MGMYTKWLSILGALYKTFDENKSLESTWQRDADPWVFYHALHSQIQRVERTRADAQTSVVERILATEDYSELYSLPLFQQVDFANMIARSTSGSIGRINAQVAEMLGQYQLLRVCEGKMKVLEPLIQQVREKKMVEFNDVMDYVLEVNGANNQLVDNFSEPQTIKDIMSCLRLAMISTQCSTSVHEKTGARKADEVVLTGSSN